MGKTPVNDNMNEVIRKSAQDSLSGDKYDLRTIIAGYEKNIEINNAQIDELLVIQQSLLKQLKIINLHLSIISNHEFDKKDI